MRCHLESESSYIPKRFARYLTSVGGTEGFHINGVTRDPAALPRETFGTGRATHARTDGRSKGAARTKFTLSRRALARSAQLPARVRNACSGS